MTTHSPLNRRLGGIAPLALTLTYGGTAWLQLLHAREGGHERNEPGFLVHWLRDGTLALPLVLLAVALATWIASRVLRRLGPDAGDGVTAALTAAAGAIGAAYVFGVGNPLHGALFEASHGGHDLPLVVHMLRDGALALPVLLLVALATVGALAAARRIRASIPAEWWTVGGRAARWGLVFSLVAPAFVLAMQGAEQARALAGPGAPCPVDAPLKSYDVTAIDVDITLNKFGDHDPGGKMYALTQDLPAVRRQEASKTVSIGLRDDAVQPLVVRANLGDCVEFTYTNRASGGEYGLHVDGLAYKEASSGDAVGRNTPTSVPAGTTRTFRYYVPNDPRLEGTHYLRPGPGFRDAVAHGLFGALAIEPQGSVYLHPDTGQPMRSGWEAMIKPADKPAFREYVKVYHEIGDEKAPIIGRDGHELPLVDPITEAYRPGSRAINYRSEPFMHRLERAGDKKSSSYNSYTFGDPATPTMRAYSADPAKIRLVHAGSEMFHVYHLHGGGIRWPQNPLANPDWDYAKVGLNKNPKTGGSNRLDSQAFGPGESYTLEIEGGAGGVQRAVGDLLEHCHIAEHYVAGMWSFWRVYNTRQVDLAPLPDRAAPPRPVDSSGLLGRTMPDGTTLTQDNLADWIKDLIPPQGVPRDGEDGSVWNWAVDRSDPGKPVYLGEPEETESWPNLPHGEPGHPGALPGDEFVGDRPKIWFNPVDGRVAYPLLRPNVGQRPPLTPNGHTGTPFLGNTANAPSTRSTPNPWANREDGLCPTGAPLRKYNLTTIQTPIRISGQGTDPTGKIYVENKDKAAVRAGDKPAEPLALRANIGDCVAITLVTELVPDGPAAHLPQSNLHIHHVQFDPQGSDGASAGMVYDQSIRPYRIVDPQLSETTAAGDRVLHLESVDKFQLGVAIGVGLGTEEFEVREITDIDRAAKTVTLDRALDRAHDRGEWAGTEFVQERWYPDVDLDNVFWHDHVDGIHGWGKGLVGQLIVEPKGSTYHDPRTGEEVTSGNIVDIHTSNPLAPGLVDGSFRELALWTIGDNPVTDSTLNLRAEPWSERLAEDPDPSLLFSSWRHGDPRTPLPQAYRRDPFVVRTVNVTGNGIDSLHVDGHRFYTEAKLRDEQGGIASTPNDYVQYGVSGRFTGILEGGAGGPQGQAGDYLYNNGIGRRFRQGAWGLLRVLPGRVPGLQPLPGTDVPDGAPVPSPTGGRPPVVASAGQPCPAGAPDRTFAVAAVDLPGAGGERGTRAAFIPSAQAADVEAGRVQPEPIVLHAAAGDCVTVEFSNRRATARSSFDVSKVVRSVNSSGINAGFNPEQTVAPGGRRTYRVYADSERIGSAVVTDFGDVDAGAKGLYGAFVVAPRGATFRDPRTGLPRDAGAQVDVELAGGRSYRDFSLLLFDDDAIIGQNAMPYPTAVDGPSLVNYRSERRPDDAMAFSSAAHGDPSTPILRAHVGDPVRVHVVGAPGSEQPHVLSLGGLRWATDARLKGATTVEAAPVAPWTTTDIEVVGGAGGEGGLVGDMWYGDLRRVFAQAGMWGLIRSLPEDSCEVRRLDGAACGARPAPAATPAPSASPAPSATPEATIAPPDRPSSGPAPAATPGPTATPQPIRFGGLQVPAAVRLATLRTTGLQFRVTVPTGTRTLRVRLVPRRRGARPSTRAAAWALVKVTGSGPVTIRWRPRPSAVGRLRAGGYALEVHVGTDADEVGLRRPITLRGRAR
jgi:hypothetical protein